MDAGNEAVSWLGHRGSDALLFDRPLKDVICLMGSSGSRPLTSSDGTPRILCHEISVGRREEWTSLDQSVLNRAVEDGPSSLQGALVPFRSDADLERTCLMADRPYLTISSQLFRELSSRHAVVALGSQGVIDIPDVVDLRSGDQTFSSLSRRLGVPFIVKGDRSVSGKHCFLIWSARDYERAALGADRQLSTAWEFVDGPSVNFHFVCFFDGVVVFYPTSQILDDSDPLRPFRFGGSALDGGVAVAAESAVAIVKRLATHLGARGYRGVGGVDIILSRRGSLVVDLNPRFQGSSLLVSQDILLAGGRPLGEVHIAAMFGASVQFAEKYSVDRITGHRRASRQVFLRNSRSSDLNVVRSCSDGRYSWTAESLCGRAPFGPGDALSEPDVVLLDLPAEGLRIAPGASLGRVLLVGENRDPPTVGRLEAMVADMLTRRKPTM